MLRIRYLMLFCITSSLVMITFGQSSRIENSAGDEKFLIRHVSIGLRDQEITTAVAFMHVMMQARAPGGIVTVSNCGEESKYQFSENRISLREALDAIVHNDPTYKWEDKDGVVNLIHDNNMPVLLELRVAKFQMEEAKTVIDALDHLLKLPEVQHGIAQLHLEELSREPGIVDLKRPGSIISDPPRLNIRCENTTVRGVLNSIARAHGFALWSYSERHCEGKAQFRIDFVVR